MHFRGRVDQATNRGIGCYSQARLDSHVRHKHAPPPKDSGAQCKGRLQRAAIRLHRAAFPDPFCCCRGSAVGGGDKGLRGENNFGKYKCAFSPSAIRPCIELKLQLGTIHRISNREKPSMLCVQTKKQAWKAAQTHHPELRIGPSDAGRRGAPSCQVERPREAAGNRRH